MVFYKFSQLAGRVTPTSPNTAYIPQGLQGAPAETSEFMFDSSKTREAPVAPAFASQVSSGSNVAAVKGVVPSEKGYQNIVKLQKAWAIEDGLMVWQKRGMRDRMPMWVTFGLMGVGMAICVTNLYKMSFPQPPSQD